MMSPPQPKQEIQINDEDQTSKVIIIGAGFAGLSVAYHLKLHFPLFDFLILEARDRIGGRVYPFDLDGTTVALGGQWVHEASKKNPIRQLLKDFKIPFQKTTGKSRKNPLFDQNGKEMNRNVARSAANLFYKAVDDYEVDEVSTNTSVQDLLDKALELKNISEDDIEFHLALNSCKHNMEAFEGGRLWELSAALGDMYQSKGGPDELPKGGYGKLLEQLVDRIGWDRIRLGCPVDSVHYQPTRTEGEMQVQACLRKNGEAPILGKYCICTFPLGVLQKREIRFVPDLPGLKWKAIDSIGMGMLEKIILKFDRRFWGDLESFDATHENLSHVKDFFDCSEDDSEPPTLMVFLGGDAARRINSLDGLSDEEAVEEALVTLKAIFGQDTTPDPVAAYVTRWNLDPFSYGSYSFTQVGSTEADYDEVARPVGNLFFAGEHTSKYSHASVHGAWETGLREYERLIESVGMR